MSEAAGTGATRVKEAALPRRDWLLLPLIALLTIAVLVGGAEAASRRLFHLAGNGTRDCSITDDLVTGTRGVPNSVCWDKDLESQLVEYRFNRCGHRTSMDCGPKAEGVYRIVMAGSSFAGGAQVAESESFAGLLPGELTRRTGRRIELYNEGIFRNGMPSAVEAQFKDVLAAQPDLILLVVTPWDIENAAVTAADSNRGGRTPTFAASVKALVDGGSTAELNQYMVFHSRTLFALRHFLYLSQSQYMKSYLMESRASSFLWADWSAQGKNDLSEYAARLAQIAAQAKAAGVPLAVVLIPNRAEATMVSMGEWPAGYDPYKLRDEVRSLTSAQGATFIDIVPDFKGVPNAERYYLPVDGHPYASGHALIADLMAKELTGGAVPALRAAAPVEQRATK